MPRRLQPPVLSSHALVILMLVTILGVLVLLWAPSAGADVVVDQCGVEVPDHETGYVVADLDCAGLQMEGVVLGDHSRLVLSGHAIVGDPEDAGRWQGVRCGTGTVCTVIGPGSIVGFSASGVAGTRVRLRDLVIAGNGRAGVAAFENVIMDRVTIGANGQVGIHAGGRVRARRSIVVPQPARAIIAEHSPRYRPGCTPG